MKKALLVGINDYEWAPLNGCANDAIELAKVLSRNHDETLNFMCKVMVSDQDHDYDDDSTSFPSFSNNEVKRTSLRKALEELFESPCDIVLFFFSGHGELTGGNLVTSDARKYDEGVSVSTLLQLANKADHIKEIFLMLDCCYSGKLGEIPELGENKALLREGISILTASTANQVARERNGVGIFTSALIEGLCGGAADVSGNVTAASLYNFADKTLGAFEQRPVYKAHVTSLRSIRQAEPTLTVKELRKIPSLFQNPNDKKTLDKGHEPTEEPRNEEKEKEFELLQKFRAASLVRPSTNEHLYFEALAEGSCELTPLGKLYWKMVKKGSL